MQQYPSFYFARWVEHVQSLMIPGAHHRTADRLQKLRAQLLLLKTSWACMQTAGTRARQCWVSYFKKVINYFVSIVFKIITVSEK